MNSISMAGSNPQHGVIFPLTIHLGREIAIHPLILNFRVRRFQWGQFLGAISLRFGDRIHSFNHLHDSVWRDERRR